MLLLHMHQAENCGWSGGDARNALICISVSAQLLLVIKVAASPEINIPENNSVFS